MSEKYPNGYWSKIEYWTGKLKDEVANTKVPDLKVIDSIHRKLDFFIQKQWDLTISVK
jgi:hypothetical protein